MLIVGCDYHPRWQQVAWLDTESGETGEQKLVNGDGSRGLVSAAAGAVVDRVGIDGQQSVVCRSGEAARP